MNNKNDYFNYQSNNNGNKEVIYSSPSYESFKTAKLCLDGNDRFYERDASYFRLLQPLNHNLKIPTKHIYMYSFSLGLNRVQHKYISHSNLIFLFFLKVYHEK